MLKDFIATLESAIFKEKLHDLKGKVESFARKFPMPIVSTFQKL